MTPRDQRPTRERPGRTDPARTPYARDAARLVPYLKMALRNLREFPEDHPAGCGCDYCSGRPRDADERDSLTAMRWALETGTSLFELTIPLTDAEIRRHVRRREREQAAKQPPADRPLVLPYPAR
jgi:hypothetical protein